MFYKKKNFFNIHNITEGLKNLYMILTRKRRFQDVVDFFKEPSQESLESENKSQKKIFLILDCILLLIIYTFLFSSINMGLLLKEVIPLGGDIPFHFANYIDFKEIFLPNGELTGWSDASYAGYNIFQSYPILPFILIYFLDLFIGAGAAFKVVLMLGAIGLPLAIYWMLSETKVSRPGPILGAILSLAYLFHDDHFAFGGNLSSVFSGEFAHSLSILFLVIFCGFLYKAFQDKKYIIPATLALAVIGFTHPVSFAVAFFLPLFFFIENVGGSNRELRFLGKSMIAIRIMFIAGLLFCTWAIGYCAIEYFGGFHISKVVSSGYGWTMSKDHYLIPKLLFPLAIFFLAIGVTSLFRASKLSRLQSLFLWGFLISTGFFLLKFMGFAVRFLPLMYLFVILFIATSMGLWYKNARNAKIRILLYSMTILSLIGIYTYVQVNAIFHKHHGTSGYIFEGVESKGEWDAIQLISEFLSKNYNTQTEENRTESYPPRVFSVFKGDLFRAISQATMYDSLFSEAFFSVNGKGTVNDIKNKKIVPEKIWRYMELSNTSIIIATKDLAQYLKNTKYFLRLQTFGSYTILKTNNTPNVYVVPIRSRVYAISDLATWRGVSKVWYKNYYNNLKANQGDPFYVYETDMKNSPFKKYTKYNRKKISKVLSRDKCTAKEFVERKEIRIQTNCIGRPLLIKFSYHPNWQVVGAKKIYLTTPGFMLIVPEQKDVTLFYGKKPYNYLAYLCGILGVILIFTYGFFEKSIIVASKKIYQRHKQIFQKIALISKKTQLKKIRLFLGKYATSIIFTFIILISVAFLYSVNL